MEAQQNQKEVINHGGARRSSGLLFVLRLLGFTLTFAATVVMALAKDTKVIPIPILSGMPPMDVPVPAKWQYMSAFVYFVVSNAVASTYGVLSLVFSMASGRAGSKIIITLDLLMVALLSSSSGAAGAVGVLGYQGNSHVNWNKVCNVFDKFCHRVAAAILLSQLAAVAFLLLTAIAAMRPYK